MSLPVESMQVREVHWLAKSMVGVVVAKSQSLLGDYQAEAYSLSHQVVGLVSHPFVGQCAARSENRPR